MATVREAIQVVEAGYEAGVPVILVGSPGIGKSAAVKAVAKKRGIGLKVFEAPSLDPTDVRGFLVKAEDGRAVFTKSPLMPSEEDGQEGILLIDEISSAIPDVQVSLHALFHPDDRRLGEHKLPDGWIPMATGNRVEDSAGARHLLSALRNRCILIEVTPNLDEWIEDFAIPNGVTKEVIGFLTFNRAKFVHYTDGASATPRTWHLLSKMMKVTPRENLHEVASGLVGAGVAFEFITYLEVYGKLPSPQDFIEGKVEFPPADELSLRYALTTSVADYVRNRKKEAVKAFQRLAAVKDAMEFILLYVRMTKEFLPEYQRLVEFREIAHQILVGGA
jgi:hypothetical protein